MQQMHYGGGRMKAPHWLSGVMSEGGSVGWGATDASGWVGLKLHIGLVMVLLKGGGACKSQALLLRVEI